MKRLSPVFRLLGAAALILVVVAPAHGQANNPLPAANPNAGAPALKPKAFFRKFQSARFQSGELYVKFRDGTLPAKKTAAHAGAGMIRIKHAFQVLPGTYHITVPPGRELAAVNAYLDDPDVLYAEPIYLAEPQDTTPNDSGWPLWGMLRINAENAWDVWRGFGDFKIGIVDSGLNYQHSDLAANVWTNPGEIPANGIDDDGNGKIDDVRGWNFADNNNDVMDVNSYHGTHVAGTIGAVGNNGTGVVGLNWFCKLVIAKCGRANETSLFNTTQGLEYLLTNGVKVSNHSYGSTNFTQTQYNMFQRAMQMGHLAICAAGNDGVNMDVQPFYPAAFDLPNIISVGAIDRFGTLNYNYGQTNVDLVAPGVEILSTTTGSATTESKNGTSMASPHVAGAVALVWSMFPQLTWQQVRTRIVTGVTPGGYAVATGGRLDVSRSLAVFVNPHRIFPGGVGTADDPFKSFDDGLADVPDYGQLYLQNGSLVRTARISSSSPARISPYSGAVRIVAP